MTKKPTRSRRSEPPVNAAIRQIAEDEGLMRRELAEMLYVSTPTVFSWFRTKNPTQASRTALALLCCKLKMSPHPILKQGGPPKR